MNKQIAVYALFVVCSLGGRGFDGFRCIQAPGHHQGVLRRFDEMMEYLRRHNAEERKAGRETERFGQVVALDLGFELFARIWCVAELVEAEKLHLSAQNSERGTTT